MSLPADTPVYNQQDHGADLQKAYEQALGVYESQYNLLGINPVTVDMGVAVEYKFRTDAKVDVRTLENAQGAKIELLNVRLNERGNPEAAIIYIPQSRKDYLKKSINAYSDPSKNISGNKPKNYKKFDKTETFEAATIEKFWVDKSSLPSNKDQLLNWEIWLRDKKYEIFKKEAEKIEGAAVSPHKLDFPDREICSIYCSLNNLKILNLITKAITGFRYLPTLAGFFDALPPREQRDWNQDLSNRIVYNPSSNVSVCILDTGLFKDHLLLRDYIANNGTDSVDPVWGSEDHDGHGTQMSGLALFGDLTPILETTEPIEIKHSIESVKVFPPLSQNHNEHVGYITAQAVSRAEINLMCVVKYGVHRVKQP